jgi:hypothetical protein
MPERVVSAACFISCAALRHLSPWPHRVTTVFPPRTLLRLRTHLMDPPVHQGLNMWVSPLQRGLGEESIGGGGVALVVDGILSDPCRPMPARTGLEVELEWCQWVHSASYVAAMA